MRNRSSHVISSKHVSCWSLSLSLAVSTRDRLTYRYRSTSDRISNEQTRSSPGIPSRAITMNFLVSAPSYSAIEHMIISLNTFVVDIACNAVYPSCRPSALPCWNSPSTNGDRGRCLTAACRRWLIVPIDEIWSKRNIVSFSIIQSTKIKTCVIRNMPLLLNPMK